jgi:ABC-type xylose transport system permease subunit
MYLYKSHPKRKWESNPGCVQYDTIPPTRISPPQKKEFNWMYPCIIFKYTHIVGYYIRQSLFFLLFQLSWLMLVIFLFFYFLYQPPNRKGRMNIRLFPHLFPSCLFQFSWAFFFIFFFFYSICRYKGIAMYKLCVWLLDSNWKRGRDISILFL